MLLVCFYIIIPSTSGDRRCTAYDVDVDLTSEYLTIQQSPMPPSRFSWSRTATY